MRLIAPGFAALALFSFAATACAPPGADRDRFSLATAGGHVLDSRGWAVGSTGGFSVSSMGMEPVSLELDDETGVTAPAEDPYAYGSDLAIGGAFALSSGWDSQNVSFEREGNFDVVVRDGLRVERQRVGLSAEEPADWTLGVVLDDCPEFADVVIRDEPTFVEGASITLAPTALDADGNQLLGNVDYTYDSDLDSAYDDWGWYGGFIYLDVTSEGFVSVTVDGEEREFPVHTVSADEVAALQIASQPEKHGVEDQSLLAAVGVTADGIEVHGIAPQWSNGGYAAEHYVASNSDTVEACFGAACTTWTGPGVR